MKTEENLIIDALEQENIDLLNSLNSLNERLKLMKIKMIQVKLETGAIVISTLTFALSMVYWSMQ